MKNLLPWFALKSVPGIGDLNFKRLIDRFQSPERVFEASLSQLLAVQGLSQRLASAIKGHKIPDAVKKELDRVSKKRYRILTLADPDYPALLCEIPDPPPFLYVAGRINPAWKNIAVVGSRSASTYGLSTTRRLCSQLAAYQFTVVSGMALGIDTAAHQGALMGNGPTVAVLGSGLENIYPPENRRLFQEIAENGAVVSEFPLSTEPEGHNFPRRNRIISGMSLGAVIVEATRKSGSLITARLAAEQGREVFAVPGSIQSYKSRGTHSLIKQGAKLVERVEDIVEELFPQIDYRNAGAPQASAEQACPPADLSPEELTVYQALEPYPIHVDDLVHHVSLTPGRLLSVLLALELKGLVQQAPGKLFALKEK